MRFLLVLFVAALVAGCGQPSERDYSQELRGRFIIEDAKCAGWEFGNSDTLLWRNEDVCHVPDTFLITWLDKRTFLAKSTRRYVEECPPLVWAERVEHFDGAELHVTDIGTGWAVPFEHEALKFERWDGRE